MAKKIIGVTTFGSQRLKDIRRIKSRKDDSEMVLDIH